MRTTVDIADPILADVKRVQAREGKALGEIVTELLAEGLAARQREEPRTELKWIARDLGPRFDLREKEAIWALLDRDTIEAP
jgi:hypothetical protein